jgi:membrane protease YdiL (CAAX protease family)
VSDVPPDLPSQPPPPPPPPPPPLPPAPNGYAPQPAPIGWGMGDVFWGLLGYLVGGVLSALVLIATGSIDSSGSIDDLSPWLVAVSLIGGWLGFVGWPVVATYSKGQRSLARDFGLEVRWVDTGWGLLGGVAALVLSVVAGVLWQALSGDDAPSNADFLPDDPGLVGALVLVLFVAVLTPIAEELFFRGLFLRAAGRKWGLPIGVVVSSIVFGLFHFEGSPAHGIFIVAVTALYGSVFALLVVRAEGRLGPAIVAHACVNGVGVLTLLLG